MDDQTTHADVAALVRDCAGQGWRSEQIAPAGPDGVLVSITPRATIQTQVEQSAWSQEQGPRLRAWVAYDDGWDREHLVTRDFVDEDEWVGALEEMTAQVQAARQAQAPAVLAAVRDTQVAYAAAQDEEKRARSRRDEALAVALADGHTHETIAGWAGLTRGRVGQLATALRKNTTTA